MIKASVTGKLMLRGLVVGVSATDLEFDGAINQSYDRVLVLKSCLCSAFWLSPCRPLLFELLQRILGTGLSQVCAVQMQKTEVRMTSSAFAVSYRRLKAMLSFAMYM